MMFVCMCVSVSVLASQTLSQGTDSISARACLQPKCSLHSSSHQETKLASRMNNYSWN